MVTLKQLDTPEPEYLTKIFKLWLTTHIIPENGPGGPATGMKF